VKLPGLLDYRDLAIRMVASACKLVESDRADRDGAASAADREFDAQVISAFGEAFNNVALHSYASRGGDLEIEIEPGIAKITIRLKDYGKSFDIDAVPRPDLDSLPESGLGLFIIRQCMDKVTYTIGQPNVLTMTKFLVQEDGGEE
jgi:serine/threonine-protein kinase RsbW